MTTIYDADILLVDDNPDLLALVADNLHTAGYKTVRTASSCADAKTAFARRRPELMILDINLPDGDGFGLFRDLHAGSDVPALFLSARDADADRLFGLGLGADDYLTKPFLMQELLLRVQHILQRAYRAELCRPRTVAMGSVTVDLQDAAVHRAEGTAALTATERAILQKLADERGHIVTYDALCEAVWGADYYGYENSLNVHIRHLREKIEADPGRPQWLVGGGVSCRVVPDFQRDPGVLQGLCRGVFQVADLLDEVSRRVHLGAKIGLDAVVVLVDGGVELRCIVVFSFQLCPADAKHRHEHQRDEHDRCRAALFGRGGQF